MSDRVPCINPRCRRTFKRTDEHYEVICGKCFKALPERERQEHRRCWREVRKWRGRILKTADELKLQRMSAILHTWRVRLATHWDEKIKAPLLAPEKPEGLEAFLEEMGL